LVWSERLRLEVGRRQWTPLPRVGISSATAVSKGFLAAGTVSALIHAGENASNIRAAPGAVETGVGAARGGPGRVPGTNDAPTCSQVGASRSRRRRQSIRVSLIVAAAPPPLARTK
jgi:hypothetical protein